MEHEIRKHIHNVLNEVVSRKRSIWKRGGEIIIEMSIIVFAVSFAVFLERQREYHHEQKEVKEFLTGLRFDLENDIKEMQEDAVGYKTQAKWFTYFGKEKTPNPDTVKKYGWVIWNSVHLLVNSGRYEGFKASGKINTIENMSLRNNILDLYQEVLVALTANTSGYIEVKKYLQRLIYQKRTVGPENDDNLATVLTDTEVRNYCLQLRYTGEPVRRYDSAINRSKRIIEQINTEYPGE